MRMDENFLRYSGLDSACTLEVHDGFWPQLDPVFMPAYQMTVNILPVLMFMQTRGVLINEAALAETRKDVLKAAEEKQKELDELIGRHLNVNSSKQCQAYFYDELRIPPYKNKGGNPTVDDLALQRLVRGTAARPGLRQAKLVQEIRGLQKLHSTYLDLEYDADGRLRGSYNPRGTKFGRLSSSKTIFGTGTNFQNLPAEFKKFLVPDPGYVFVDCDKRQAEWIVVAYLTGDANMISAIEQGIDVHTHTAHLMYNVSYEIIKKEHKLCGSTSDSDYIAELRNGDLDIVKAMRDSGKVWPRTMSLRQNGKKSNHGLNYGETWFQFSQLNELPADEAKRTVAAYHKIYAGIGIWYESIKRLLQKDRTLTNCFGRAVRFLGAWGDDLFKSAYSMLPQSSVVDSLNMGMERIYEDSDICGIDRLNADVLAQVHDSILMQVPIAALKDREKFEWFIDKIKDYTSPEMRYSGRAFKIPTDFKFGMNWGGYNKDKNPLGMQEFEDYDSFMNALADWEKLSDGQQPGTN